MSLKDISRAAVGRHAQIGALYDVRTESFLDDSLFDDETVEVMELGDISVELVMSDSIQDKFHKLDIEAELRVSLLAGLVKLSGSGAYLNEEKKSARTQSMSLIYKIQTVNEEFMLRQNKNKIDTELLSKLGEQSATHVVVGIDWGAICSITCECENTEGKDETAVKGMLDNELRTLKSLLDVKGSAKVDYQGAEVAKVNKFTFRCKSDVSSTEHDLPSSFEGALQLAKSIPKLVQKTNGGKGVPLLYMLKPLDAVAKICRLPLTLKIHFATIKEDTIKKSAQVLETITGKRQRLFDIQTDLRCFGEYVADGTLATVDKYVDEIDSGLSAFRAQLQELVPKIRRKEEDVAALETLPSKTLSDALPVAKYESYIRQFQDDFRKLDVIKSWKDRGIVYLGKNDQFLKDDARTVYVFYKPKDGIRTAQSEQNEDFFLRCHKMHSQQSGTAFKVVDEAVRPDLWAGREKKATIKVYKNGAETCGDFYEREGRDTEMCLVKHYRTEPCRNPPNERACAKLSCPNAILECSETPATWYCSKCKEVVEYGVETFQFYCKCGKYDPHKCDFRCNDKVHGTDYIPFPSDTLRDDLGCLRVIERNILILGETGVGKSTWINGIVNYLSFANLDEAKRADDYHVLIPSQLTHIDSGRSVVVKIGKGSDNEDLEVGHSATQEPRSYIFYVGDLKLRLIDTPGIGDSRGIEQDKKNFDNILSHLSRYDKLHAICILLKPNNSRLTVMFNFCIQELLAHLHTSAKKNIVFCFTNARATFYQPGETLPALNKLLQDRNIGITANPKNYFCFDNEPFRFLACLHSGIRFGPEDVRTFAASWDKAVAETNRLIGHMEDMDPHKVRNTVSMNEARRVIVAMSKPMAKVVTTIQENMRVASDAKAQIDLHARDTRLSDLKRNLKFTGVDLVRKELPSPIIVCAHQDCIEIISVGKSKQQTVNYKQVCHNPCRLLGTPTETTNDSRVWWCSRFRFHSGNCRQCEHHYTDHMHLTYTMKKIPKEFISDALQKRIMARQNEKEKEEEFKRSVDEKVAELQNEKSTILQISAKYKSYLKANAIIPYNDAVGDYLKMVIKQEENKADASRDSMKLERLQKLQAEYEKEKEILDETLETGAVVETTSEEVMQLLQKLFELKHFGKTLKHIFDGISNYQTSSGMHFGETVAPILQRSPNGNQGKRALAWFQKGWSNLKHFLL